VLKIKLRGKLSFEKEGKPEQPCEHGSHHDPPIHGGEIYTEENEDTGAEGETEGAIRVLYDLPAD